MLISKGTAPIYNWPELRGSLECMRYPALAEIKLDGEFDFIYYDELKKPYMWTVNKYGTTRSEYAELDRLGGILWDKGIRRCVLMGELYFDKGKKGQLYQLLERKKIDDNLHLCPFDIYSLNENSLAHESLLTRKEILNDLIGQWGNLESKVVQNSIDVQVFFEAVTMAEYEGIVVKSLDEQLILGPCNWVKVKFKDKNDLFVAFVDGTQERIEVIHRNVGVGVKCPNKYKKFIKPGDTVTIEHQGVLASGSLRHPVLIPKKEWA